MTEKTPTILFYIAGPAPTETELAAAAKIGTKRFRNAQRYVEGEALEACDAVAGCAPAAYLKKYPQADKVAEPEAKKAKPAVKVDPPPPPPPPVVAADAPPPPWAPVKPQ